MLDTDRGRGHDRGGSSIATQYAKGCNSDRNPQPIYANHGSM